MRRLFTFFLMLAVTITVVEAQSLSDEQIVEYVQNAEKRGLSQSQIATELLKQGVTRDQAERIKAKYGNAQNTTPVLRQTSAVGRRADNNIEVVQMDDVLPEMIDESKSAERVIYGRDFFSNRNLSFEPNENLATPIDYRLGPGDEVIIDVWGDSQSDIKQVISPEGNINVDRIGPVYLNGMTIEEARNYMQQVLSKIYSTLEDGRSKIHLTLGQIRSIQVNIMGEVQTPGTYRLSAFATVFHALYRAGGVNLIGSLRDIRLMRGGKIMTHIDVYKYLMDGQPTDNFRLEEGDAIIVPTYQNLAKIEGKVKRPMYYEMLPDETVNTLIEFAGGFTGDAYMQSVRLIRSMGREKQIYSIDSKDFGTFKLVDADDVSVDAVLDRFENRIEIRGAVFRPGLYQLGEEVRTVKQLILKAEGLQGDAFLDRVILMREKPDYTLQTIPLDLRQIMDNSVYDIVLNKNDVLIIPGISELREPRTMTIKGYVARPGTYPFAAHTTIEDLIVQAGGLLEAASTARIDVSRRVKNPAMIDQTNLIGETFTFHLADSLITGPGEFFLEPFDEVYVRKSPAYFPQQTVYIGGEVLFGGTYALKHKNQRLSELISDAGGVTKDAYMKGARLVRRRTYEEQVRELDALRMAQMSAKDSINVALLNIAPSYTVGIDLEQALSDPDGQQDIVLHEGDSIYIPEYINTVKISGAVMYPNTILYKPGEKLKYYINNAGGYGERAKKSKVYIVYMNGTVSQARRGSSKVIRPGCEIIIPTKPPRGAPMSIVETVTLGTATASLASIILTLINSLK